MANAVRPVLLCLAVSLLAPGLAGAAKKRPSVEPPEGALIAEIPWEGHENNRIWLDLAPEGNARPFRLMLETGTTASILTPGAARAQGVRVRRLKDTPYRRKTKLGKDLLFWIRSESGDSASPVGWEYALFGGDQLYPYVFELDFGSQVVRFYESRKYKLPRQTWSTPREAVLKMRVTGNRPFIDIELEGEKLQVLIDTGNPATMGVPEPQLAKRGVDPESLPPFLTMGGTVGEIDHRFYEAKSVKIGPFELEHVPVLVATGSFNLGGRTDSTIGYDLLRQFDMRLDYAHERLWLRRREGIPLTLFGTNYQVAQGTGAVLRPSGPGYAVMFVHADSLAAELGLRAGDRIDGQWVSGEGRLLDRIVMAMLRDRKLTVVRDEDGVIANVELVAQTGSGPGVASGPQGASDDSAE